ncbi:MAG: hypothetical protein V3W31_10400, partial [Thermodesulfobacteriota bacterium]
IREKVLAHGQRLLPVLYAGDAGRVAGVVTRTDILKLLQEELAEKPGRVEKKRRLTSLMKERLPGWALEILREIGRTAEGLGFQSYVVGGFVRDLLLKRENLDMDVVIEGDGIKFAAKFAEGKGLKVRSHERFKTAVVIFPDGIIRPAGFKLDVATARLEYYERPSALPTVELSSLKLDLYRRDFTINTLAVALNPERFGEVVDFFSAQRDIKEKTIKVLHNLSFVEDPTRAFRAVRFAERFGFRMARHTLNLIKNTVKLDIIKKLSGPRLRDEMKNVLKEDAAAGAVKRLDELGLLKLIHPSLAWDERTEKLFERTREVLAWHRLLYTPDRVEEWLTLLLALTDGLTEEEFAALGRRLSIVGKKRQAVVTGRSGSRKALKLIETGRVKTNGDLYELLHPLPLELLLYLMAGTEEEQVKKDLSNYVTHLRNVKVSLGGNDLKKLGVAEGPDMGEILGVLFRKKLNGEVETKKDEEEFVKEWLATIKGRA